MYSSNRLKSKQQLITLLEPRRLMSISGGMDFAPSDSAATQYTHSFGFEHTLGATDAQMPSPAHFAPVGRGFTDGSGANDVSSDDTSLMEAQFAPSVAQGPPVNFGDAGADNGPALGSGVGIDHSVHVNTLAMMYSELNTSTANSIDDATTTSSATSATLNVTDNATFRANVDAGTANAFSGSTSTGVAPSSRGVSISAINFGTTSTATQTATALSASIAPPITLPSSLMLEQATSASADAGMAALPRLSVQNVEQELLTVGNLASEMIAQLGRDIAIEMSHLQSDLGLDGMTEQFTTHWDGWRSAAAVAGAAIATIVYVQSEADREKPKAATFSTQLIQAIPG